MAEGREYAIVVFGASGFTGQFVATEVAKNNKGTFKWAVAGRNKEKLLQVLAATAEEVGTYTEARLDEECVLIIIK